MGINQTHQDIEKAKILAPIVGHVGDGNFHLVLLVDHNGQDEVAAAEVLHRKMVIRALTMDGTCPGEHDIGYGKIEFLQLKHSDAVQPMRLIKQASDSDNILNPEKIFA